MSWASIATNQTISADNLANGVSTGVLIPKGTLSFGGKQLTNLEVFNSVYVAPISKPNNQLVVKSDVSANVLYPGYWVYYSASYTPQRYDPVNGSTSLSSFGANNYSPIACSQNLKYIIMKRFVDVDTDWIVYSLDGGSTITSLPAVAAAGFTVKVAVSNDGAAMAIFEYHRILISYGDPNSYSVVLTTSYDEQVFRFCQSGNGQNYYGIKYDAIYNTTVLLKNTAYGGGSWSSTSPTEINGYEFNDVSCSYDGTYQLYVGLEPVPAAMGRYVLSTNGGSSFSVGYLGTVQFRSCCISDTGQYMIMTNDAGGIWTSNNYGSSFTYLGVRSGTSTTYSCSVNAAGTMWMVGTDTSAIFATAYDTPISSWTAQTQGYAGEYNVAC